MELHRLLFESCSAASLSLLRILWGTIMLMDLIHERGLSQAHVIWTDETIVPRCYFPLFAKVTRFKEPEAMLAVYSVMFVGLIGIITGFYYRLSCFLYSTCFWYLLAIDKSRWNNHSYLFGILALFGLFNDANAAFSVDSYRLNLRPSVPRWQYLLLRFQLFLVYFYAGVKKIHADWLGGFSMVQLSKHVVWSPFRLVFSDDFIDFYIIHLGGFIFDISVGFLYLFKRSRIIAALLSVFFNMMNSQLFRIGMFPWMMIAMIPIFYDYDWPLKPFRKQANKLTVKKSFPKEKEMQNWTVNQYLTAAAIFAYITFQLTFPFSHGFLPGLKTWTDGHYGYSWDMMIHNWNRVHTTVRVKSATITGTDPRWSYVDPEALTLNQRWTHSSQMLLQYRDCLGDILRRKHNRTMLDLRVDVWSSLNGRFVQRIFRPVNLLDVQWSPFKPNKWVLPLSTESEKWRQIAESWDSSSSKSKAASFSNDTAASSYTIYIVDYPEYSFTANIPDSSLVFFHLLSGKVNVLSEGHEYFVTEPSRYVRLRGSVRIRVYGQREAYYAIVHWNDLPAKKRQYDLNADGRSRAGLGEMIKHSILNIRLGWIYLYKFVEKNLGFTEMCACET